jgi:sugar phosphate isomerase/epimerase
LSLAAGTVAGTAIWPPSLGAAQRAEGQNPGLRIGACVVSLEQGREAGLDGIEVPVGGAADRLEITRPEVQERYKELMAVTGVPICSLMMAILNDHPLAADPRGPAWLGQSIEAAHALGAKVILVAFFGNGDLLTPDGRVKRSHLDVVARRLKAAAPRAHDAGVILGVENYLDARENTRLLDRVGHESVRLYYDCYNIGGTRGYDVPAEIQGLKDRIAQFHFKNGPDFLDTGKVKFEPIAEAIKAIGFRGWVVLETSSPTGDAVADVQRNAAYVRKLFA